MKNLLVFMLTLSGSFFLGGVASGMEKPEQDKQMHNVPSTQIKITDVNGCSFILDAKQSAAFKSCAIYRNLTTDELVVVESDYNLENCQTKVAIAKNIAILLDIIAGNATVESIAKDMLIDFFDLALYFGAPESIMQTLATEYYEYAENSTDARNKYFLACASQLLPFYPTFKAFLEDFEKKYVQNDKSRWDYIYRGRDEYSDPSLNLSHVHLTKIGFTKKIRSLKGLSLCANIPGIDTKAIHEFIISGHGIKDFSIRFIQDIFPQIATVCMVENTITHLHKKQFEGMHGDLRIFVNNNPISTIDADTFAIDWNQVKYCAIHLQKIPLSKKSIQNAIPCLPLKNKIIQEIPTGIGMAGFVAVLYGVNKIENKIGKEKMEAILQRLPLSPFLKPVLWVLAYVYAPVLPSCLVHRILGTDFFKPSKCHILYSDLEHPEIKEQFSLITP